MYFLGIDLGSSSVKIALVEKQTGKPVAVVHEPKTEMGMYAQRTGWAEQDPEEWWQHICKGIKRVIKENTIDNNTIKGIGISYQMHGLVAVDSDGQVLRHSIIWCDSRAVAIGEASYETLSKKWCDTHLLNAPGNFTASKLRWVQMNEPEIYARIHKIMLPGDYIAYRFTDKMNTTISGLTEGVFWNFKSDSLADELLEHYGIESTLFPEIVETFAQQGILSERGAMQSGLLAGTPILYRAGDQPNNALSLNVFKPGEIAATGGTSGVMFAVTDNLSTVACDQVNNFAHVNYHPDAKRIGKLLCINGAGILYRWLKDNLDVNGYEEMNELAQAIEIGAEGVTIIPFGNGAERMLKNKVIGTRILHLDLNRHHKGHICRAALEGIAFSFVYGFEIMKGDGISPSVLKVGNDNLFRSQLFCDTIATLIGQPIEIYTTTGAIGAARACTIHDGGLEAFSSMITYDFERICHPLEGKSSYQEAYLRWKKELEIILKT